MILTVMRIAWLNLRRDRVAQAMTFVLPIAFFSIFAAGVRRRSGDATPACASRSSTRTRTETSGRLRARRWPRSERCGSSPRRARARSPGRPTRVRLDRARAEQLVREGGDVPWRSCCPPASARRSARFDGPAEALLLLADPSDPIARAGRGAAAEDGDDCAARRAREAARCSRHAGALTPQQRR